MGRRALRKIDPRLDYRPWLVAEDQLPNPVAVQPLFGRGGPLEIEVGTGKGLFLTRATAAAPDRLFLGIELSGKYARYAAARLAKLDRRNGKIIHGNGVRIFHEWLADGSAAAVHVYFPDPWWKTRHRKRRIMTETFVRDVYRVLEPGGLLHFWTDVREYFDSTKALIAGATPFLPPEFPAALPATHDLDYRTHFERRTRLHDLPVYRAVYRKGSG